MTLRALGAGVLVWCLGAIAPARAGQSPVDVVDRDAATGKTTIRATRLSAPLRIDGRLDEALYDSVIPVSDFVQMEPNGGKPASEKTDVWIAFDERNIYVAMRAWESQPERMIANEMRRDSNNIRLGDCVGFCVRYVLRPSQCAAVRSEPARRPHRRPEHERAAVQRRLESGVGARGRKVRRRLDHRGGGPVQVDSLCGRDGAELGLSGAPQQQVEERNLLSHRGAAGVWHRAGQFLRVAVRDA